MNSKQQRMTKQKQMVIDILELHHDHPTADQIYLEVRAIDAHISRGTVYRNLEQLSESGYLLHVKVPGPDRYERRLEYHYHLVCRNCGALWDSPLEYQHQMDKEVSEKTGFKIERHRMIFEGLCSACQSENSGKAKTE